MVTEIKITDDQKKAIKTRDKNIIVSAAAGSGKTMVLVDRIISLMLEEHIDIDKMIIVTFTNKSAIDMKNKIRLALEKRADDFDYGFLKRQMKLLKTAHIKTLHAFCSDMIRENFYYFDKLSPNFKIMQATTSVIYKTEAINEVFDQEYEKMDESFRMFLQNFSREKDDADAKKVILNTYEKIIGQTDPMGWLDKNISSKKSISNFLSYMQRNLEKLKDKAYDTCLWANENQLREKLQEAVTADYQTIEAIYDASNSYESLTKALANFSFSSIRKAKDDDNYLYKKLRSKKFYVSDTIRALKAQFAILDDKFLDFTLKKEDILLEEIARLTKIFMNKFDKKKKARDYLDFNDLEQYFIRLLDNQTARAKLVDSFAYIFFDEYQDSNEIQNHIINLLKRDRNLFFVGDVKQSIYGFRRARPDLFLEKLDTYENDSDSMRINLNENFRTDKLLLDFNNYIFDRIMTKEDADIAYKKGGHRLNFGRDKLNENSKVGIRVLDKDINEEDYLVDLINDLVNEGYRYKDIAILLRVGKGSYKYEEAFKKANIPYYNDISKVSLDAAEVSFFINILRYLINPNDDLTLMAILRSSIFDIDEDDLAKIRLESDSYKFYEAFEAYDKDPALLDKINNFNKLINDLKDKLAILSLYDFANYLFEKSGLYDFLMARDLAEDRINNIDSIIDLMGEYDKTNDNGLYGFVEYFSNIERLKDDSIDQSRDLSEEENLVRIMTVHKSKGLEFKVVIYVDVSKGIRNHATKSNIVFDDEIGIGIDIADYEQKIKLPSLNKKIIEAKIGQEEKKEEMRILYVALTRAEERLYITGNKSKAKSTKDKIYAKENFLAMSSQLDWILSSLSYDKLGEEYFEEETFTDDFSDRVDLTYIDEVAEIKKYEKVDIKDFLEGSVDDRKLAQIKNLLDFDYKGQADLGLSLKKSVTELAKDFNKEEDGCEISSFGESYSNIDFKKPNFLEEEKTYKAVDRGTLIHKIFQKLPIKIYDRDLLKKEIDNLLDKKIIDKDGLKLIDLEKFLSFYQNDFIRDLIEKNIPYRKEESFLMTYDGFYVNGQIDLMFESDKEVILIDFKTDRIKRDDAYTSQLSIYKKAIEEALGKNVKKSLIYWYNFNIFQEVEAN